MLRPLVVLGLLVGMAHAEPNRELPPVTSGTQMRSVSQPFPPVQDEGSVRTGRAVRARRPSPFGLLFPVHGGRSLVVTDLGGNRVVDLASPCGDLFAHKLHASPRGPFVVFTCAELQSHEYWVEKAIMMVDLRKRDGGPKLLVRGLHTLLGWSPDGQRIYYWDNAITQRGHIVSRDPFSNTEDQRYCCSTVALPGPGRSVIGIDHGETDSLLELRPGENPRVIVERDWHISEIDADGDGNRLYLGLRPDEKSLKSFVLEEVQLGSGRSRELLRADGQYWLHRVAGGVALVNHVVGCRDRRSRASRRDLTTHCDDGWMVLSPLAVAVGSGAQRVLEPTPRVSGYWMTPDGALLLVRQWDDEENRSAYFLRRDGRKLGAAPNERSYGDPMWVRVTP